MMRILSLLCCTCFLLTGVVCAEENSHVAAEKPHTAHEKSHWGYTGEGEPNVWGMLSPQFERCSKGQNQSPINITRSINADLQPIGFDYATRTTEIWNNGHTIQANYSAGSNITLEGNNFELKQFHFHASSEHQINGKYFPLEVHLVHANAQGNLAVVGIMFEIGAQNTTLDQIIQKMPQYANEKQALTSINATALLPESKSYYRYNGSLTTPPCSEGVRWVVMKNPITASQSQMDAFSKVMHKNNRPIQPLNARPILH